MSYYNTHNNSNYNNLNGRSKNDKNWENWERIREQKLELMKNICFESYRQSKRDKMSLAKPKPKQLDPSWYTDNIYSNHSEDLDDDYMPDCMKYGTYRKLRNIREQDEFYGEDNFVGSTSGIAGSNGKDSDRREEGEGSSGYGLQRSSSCKEFYCPKSHSCHSSYTDYETTKKSNLPISILKNRSQVPKSYSFSATTKTTPFDEMDYHIPPTSNSRRDKQDAFRKSMGYYCSNSLDESALLHERPTDVHRCCAREHCTNARCLFEDIYPTHGISSRRHWRRSLYGADASDGSNRNLSSDIDWMEDRRNHHHHHRVATASRYSLHSSRDLHYERDREQQPPPPPTVICCCSADDYCYHRQQQHHMSRPRLPRYHCPSHHPAAEEEEHMHCRAVAYDTDVENFIRDERERLMLQDKFLDDDERYLTVPTTSHRQYLNNIYGLQSSRNKNMLDVQTPNRYDEDSCSDSTEMDLEDFNIDLEKYWEELEKPPSPIDLDMQRRNMHSNLKVKNVNVGCYNNGQPIDMHDREQERMMIKKSLLEGMPSPPQIGTTTSNANNTNNFHFFDHTSSPLHRSAFNYGYKVYPTGTTNATDTLPTYKYNNFYPEHTVQTQQPTSNGHHTSVGGHSALSLINNIFSIYKPNKYSPHNCQLNIDPKPEPCKKMNVPSTRRPLGASHSEYMHSLKRPLIVSNEQPHFKIIPEKTGLKISPLYAYDDFGDKPIAPQKLTSTARPLMLPH